MLVYEVHVYKCVGGSYHFAFIFGLKSEECYQLFVMTLESK